MKETKGGVQEAQKRPNGVDDTGSYGWGAIAQVWDGLFGFGQTQSSMRAGEMVIGKPGKKQLLKMER